MPALSAYDPKMEETYEAILITEAGGEGEDGMVAVGEVLRNRGWSPRGFFGLARNDLQKFIARESETTRRAARRACRRVLDGSDLTKGATHYENVEAFGVPRWAKKMKITRKLGRHTFYQESR